MTDDEIREGAELLERQQVQAAAERQTLEVRCMEEDRGARLLGRLLCDRR